MLMLWNQVIIFSHDDSSIDDFTASIYLKQAVEMCSKSYVQRTE